MKQGYVKLHRKILEWEWYTDTNTKAVFLHLLLTANFKETKFRGINLRAGQTIIGRKALAAAVGISEQSVRTALEHLKSTNEITIKSTNKFSVVTIENWESYQCLTGVPTSEVDNNQPPKNQQPTNHQPHHKNDKNVKNDNRKGMKRNEATGNTTGAQSRTNKTSDGFNGYEEWIR